MLRFLLVALLVAGREASNCGRPSFPPHLRIMGGVEARRNSWPWVVSILIRTNGGYFPICGGALIAEKWVITAAHCFRATYGADFRIAVGKHNMKLKEKHEQILHIEYIFTHARFDIQHPENGNDIAMVKLLKKAELNRYVQLGCLPPTDFILQKKHTCILAGWGLLAMNEKPADRLQQAVLPLVDYKTCSRKDYWGNHVLKAHICAGDYYASACPGDSGSPLNCLNDEDVWIITGVVSFGSSEACNTPKKPGVFTNLSYYYTWINSVLEKYDK